MRGLWGPIFRLATDFFEILPNSKLCLQATRLGFTGFGFRGELFPKILGGPFWRGTYKKDDSFMELTACLRECVWSSVFKE